MIGWFIEQDIVFTALIRGCEGDDEGKGALVDELYARKCGSVCMHVYVHMEIHEHTHVSK